MKDDTRKLVEKLESEINGRKGIGWEEVDDDIQEEIRETLGAIIEKHYEKPV